METQLYFWKPLMEKFKSELSLVETYYDRTRVQFSDIEGEAQRYADHVYSSSFADEDTDPSVVAEQSWEIGLDQYNRLNIMKVDHLLMTISMLYHMWEQQVVKFALKETDGRIDYQGRSLEYREAKAIFEAHEVDIEKTNSWQKIKELKCLVNTIKHGEGQSSRRLRKMRPDFFSFSGLETMSYNVSVLTDGYSLQITEDELYSYVASTKHFWDEMPERAYSDVDTIINKLNTNK
ncbi:hypothetical protein [Alkalibacillus salilacus]|uniref:Uncharacterized protein n=1 Tax=Alkalibacillus salilacus TaxID=284582 RepID=A0ABT9VIE7_9BACI|nr:hypothetical protein [Alkalibacillus salilacus]MDQ0160728.1 hypothetical protein [Alkalibacillus salilacus]